MPSITIKVQPGTSEETKHAIAKALAPHATELLKNRSIWTHFAEQEFLYNGEKIDGKFMAMHIDGPDLSYEDRAHVCKVFYDTVTPIYGDARITFHYGHGDMDLFGINGMLMPDYLKAQAAKKSAE